MIDGSRFKTLAVPVALVAGFRGTMVASGYGGDEPNGNGAVALMLATFDGTCLQFVGTSSYGDANDGSIYPGTADGGPANRYAAGTFAFAPIVPPGGLTIVPSPGGFVLNWTDPEGVLEQSPNPAPGTWQVVPGANPGIEVPSAGQVQFFRLSW